MRGCIALAVGGYIALVVSICFEIDAIDACCFAGNSSVQKVKVCHKTNGTENS